jgi:hypothetical protein
MRSPKVKISATELALSFEREAGSSESTLTDAEIQTLARLMFGLGTSFADLPAMLKSAQAEAESRYSAREAHLLTLGESAWLMGWDW